MVTSNTGSLPIALTVRLPAPGPEIVTLCVIDQRAVVNVI